MMLLQQVKKRVAKGLDITGSRLRGLLVAVGANRAGSEKEDCFGKNVRPCTLLYGKMGYCTGTRLLASRYGIR